jgi:hypothetical protein
MNANEEHEYPQCRICKDLMPKDWEWDECKSCMEWYAH